MVFIKIIFVVGGIMSLCKGKVKIGKKNLKRGTNKYFFKRYLKRTMSLQFQNLKIEINLNF